MFLGCLRLGKGSRHCHIDVWRLVPHCLMWCIWRERNARSFEGCERSLLEIKSFFLHTLYEWSVVFSHFSCSSFPIFLDSCTFVSWFVPPWYIPNVLGLALFLLLIIFLHYLSKKKKLGHIYHIVLTCPITNLKQAFHNGFVTISAVFGPNRDMLSGNHTTLQSFSGKMTIYLYIFGSLMNTKLQYELLPDFHNT